jgi:hypothetical protein
MPSRFSRRSSSCGMVALVLGLSPVGVLAAQTAEAPPAATPQQVILSCQGGGTVQASQSGTTSTYNSKTKKYETGTSTSTAKQPFTGIVRVEISGDMGRVALPKPMVPVLNSSSEGWFPIGKLASSDKEIAGQVSINALNQPKLRIDRMTGDITISGGFSEFSGKCEAIHADDKPKF